ncbi:replication initiator protein [Microvirus mar28]|uniref:Replication initiator protein n=1 Tax=Microvirus mar28 TaxID=2851161 RepID=A0A8F5ML16_9VIRU|nr:replication initiator protein [Microvirus mar28]
MPCYHPKYARQACPGAVLDFSCNPHMPGEIVQVPCGQCIGCRIDYARQWASRCVMEMQYHRSSYFLTLTYDDQHVPVSWTVDHSTGEAFPSLTCRLDDVQRWLKRLRFSGQDIRYFGCMDYGAQTFRPHYHFILFGLQLQDLEPYMQKDPTYKYFTSPEMDSIWGNGNIIIGEANYSTALYTARYICQKRKGASAQLYKDFNLEPPRSLMSRRPGIGWQYLQDHPDMMDYKYTSIAGPDGGIRIYPPRYFRQLEKVADPAAGQERSARNRQFALRIQELKSSQTQLSYWKLLSIEERQAMTDYKSLRHFF